MTFSTASTAPLSLLAFLNERKENAFSPLFLSFLFFTRSAREYYSLSKAHACVKLNDGRQ